MAQDVYKLTTLNLFEDLKDTNISNSEFKEIIASYTKLGKEYIKALVDWFESKSNTDHSTYYNAEIFHIGLNVYKIPESKFINHIFKSYKKESLINFIGKEDKDKTSKKYSNLIPELKLSEIDKENLIGIIGHDDYEKEYIIKADAELGYYKLSKCPDGVEKVKFPI